MAIVDDYRDNLLNDGYAIADNIFPSEQLQSIVQLIEQADKSAPTFRKTADLFAIRQFLKEVPAISTQIFNERLRTLVYTLFGEDYFVVKSIYFDKPESSNWFVAWHQDLTISVDRKADIPGFSSWTTKYNQFAVQPAVKILNDNFTIRIHLDDTNKDNGALSVIPASHLKGIYRPDRIEYEAENKAVCAVKAGGVMIMRPLLMHSSSKSTNGKRRRVIHLEFSRATLPDTINWAERLDF